MARKTAIRRFRYTSVLRVVVLVGAALFAAVLASISPDERPILFLCSCGVIAVALAAVVESWLAFVQIGPETITVRGLRGTRRYPRGMVSSVTWEKGAGVSLRLSDGAWAKLPDLGHSSQAVAGAVRAWLNEEAS